MRKRWIVLAAAAILLAGFMTSWAIYCDRYSVEPDNSNLLEEVCRYYSRGTRQESEADYRFYNTVDAGKQRFVLMEYGEALGVLYLQRGWNGRYRVDGRSYGDGNFREEVVEDAGRYYLVFGGRNPLFRIHRVDFLLGHQIYSAAVPQQKRFFFSLELEGNPGTAHVLPGYQVWFYDEAGRDITESVEWNGI